MSVSVGGLTICSPTICSPPLSDELLFAHTTCEFRSGAARATFVLRSCDSAAGALGLLFACYFRNLQVAIFKPRAAAAQACETRDKARSRKQPREPRDNFQTPVRKQKAEQSSCATARALRHAQPPQRVRREQDAFARRRSESSSTRALFAEGSLS